MLHIVRFSIYICILLAISGINSCPLECSCVHSVDHVTVNCSNMGLTDEPNWTQIPYKSSSFDVSRNSIRKLGTPNTDHLTRFVYMKNINFSYNLIEIIPKYWLQGLKYLEYLHLDHNDIYEISQNAFAGLLSLKVLYLDFNALTVVKASWFENLHSLQSLSIENNSITIFEPEEFIWPPTLTTLNLANNKLRSTPVLPLPRQGEQLSDDWRVNLDGNIMYCGCKSQPLDEISFPLHVYKRVKSNCLSYNQKNYDEDSNREDNRLTKIWKKYITLGVCKDPDVNMTLDMNKKMLKCTSSGYPQPQLIVTSTLCGKNYTLDNMMFANVAEFGLFHFGSFTCAAVSATGRRVQRYDTNVPCDIQTNNMYTNEAAFGLRFIGKLLLTAAVGSVVTLFFLVVFVFIGIGGAVKEENTDSSSDQYLDLISMARHED